MTKAMLKKTIFYWIGIISALVVLAGIRTNSAAERLNLHLFAGVEHYW